MYDLLEEFLPQLDWDSRKDVPPLSVEQILALADAHFAEHGSWPHSHSGPVTGTNLTWSGISERLRCGFFHERTGRWPTSCDRGVIPDSPGETWGCIHAALEAGLRGFPGGSSPHRLLKAHGLKQ